MKYLLLRVLWVVTNLFSLIWTLKGVKYRKIKQDLTTTDAVTDNFLTGWVCGLSVGGVAIAFILTFYQN